MALPNRIDTSTWSEEKKAKIRSRIAKQSVVDPSRGFAGDDGLWTPCVMSTRKVDGEHCLYPTMSIDGRTATVTRVVMALEFGQVGEDQEVDHRCGEKGIKRCINPKHLQVATRSEHRKIEARRGIAGVKRKISRDQAREIFIRARNGESTYALAREFGLRRFYVGQIKNRVYRKKDTADLVQETGPDSL